MKLEFNQAAIKNLLVKYCVLIVLMIITSCSSNNYNRMLPSSLENIPPLKVSENGRFIVTASGEPVFLNAETAWRMVYHLDTNDIKHYFSKRKEQGFNAVGVVALQPKKRKQRKEFNERNEVEGKIGQAK